VFYHYLHDIDDEIISNVLVNFLPRYAHTTVEAYLKNPSSETREVTFSMVLPDSAFFSNFSMILKGEELLARVDKKEKAKDIFEGAKSRKSAAGLVQQDTRNANKVKIGIKY
jgi:hypothetical protein